MTEELDPFDRLLTGALHARPEHAARIDIASEALSRVRAMDERAARLAKISFWTRVSSAAAVLLIVATVAIGYWKWPASTTTTDTTDSSETTSSVSSTSSIDMTTIGGGAFVVALLAVVGLTIMTPDRQTMRLVPV